MTESRARVGEGTPVRSYFPIFLPLRHTDASTLYQLGLFLGSVGGFLTTLISLRAISIGREFRNITAVDFFVGGTLPIGYWIGLCIIVVTQILSFRLKRIRAFTNIVSSWFLMISMRIVLSIIMSAPFNVDVLYNYAPWIHLWLVGGVQMAPGTYPYGWPVSFLVGYAITKLGIPVEMFFMWGQIFIYAVELSTMYYLSQEIGVGKRAGLMAVFLLAIDSSIYSYNLNYSPQLIGEMLLLLALYLCIRASRKPQSRRGLVLAAAYTSILTLTHHLSSLYLIFALSGLYLAGRFTRNCVRLPSFLVSYAVLFWYVSSMFLYPEKMERWGTALAEVLRRSLVEFPPEFTSVDISSFANLIAIDKLLFLTYPSLILALVVGAVLAPSRGKGKWYFHIDNSVTIIVGVNGVLMAVLLVGLTFQGLLYPFRMMGLVLILCIPIAAKFLLQLASSLKGQIVFGVVASLSVLLGTASIYRLVQRTVPLWEIYPKWRQVEVLSNSPTVTALPPVAAYFVVLLLISPLFLQVVSHRGSCLASRL